jgi:hypothetical protein
MDKKIPKSYLGPIVMLGAVWGLSEAALGMGLRGCAAFVSGSIMTGVALFFIASSWILSRRVFSVALLIIIASLFKMFDAFLLSLPLQHGAVANPIFAFLMEGAAFLILIAIVSEKGRPGSSWWNGSPLSRKPLPSCKIRHRHSCLCRSWNRLPPLSLLCSLGSFPFSCYGSPGTVVWEESRSY